MEISGYFMIFLKAFKQNFKQSTLIWILMAAVAVFLYMEKESLVTMPGSMPQIFNYVILAVCIPLIAMHCTYSRQLQHLKTKQ